MTIKTQFNIGDNVFYKDDLNRAMGGTIVRIEAFVTYYHEVVIHYIVQPSTKEASVQRSERELGKDFEDLKKVLRKYAIEQIDGIIQ